MQSKPNLTRAPTVETIQHFADILRLPAILKARGVSRSQHYNDIRDKLYPGMVKIGAKASGIPDYEIAAMNAAVIAGKTLDERRALVVELMAARATLA